MQKTLALLALAVLCAVGLWSLMRFDSPAAPSTKPPPTVDASARDEAPDLLADAGQGQMGVVRQAGSNGESGAGARISSANARFAVPQGTLAGTLTDRDAQPLAGMRLWVFPAELIDEAKASLMLWKAEAEAKKDEAARFAVGSTGRSGELRFENLLPGHYFIAAENDLDLGRTTLVREVFSTGDLALRLVLTPYWLRVRALGMEEEERAQGVIYCREALAERARLDEPTWEAEAAPDRALFPVEVGRTYVYGWVSDHHPPCESRVTIGPDEPTTLRLLQLGPPVEKGMVIVHVSKPDGSAWAGGCNLRALARTSGKELVRVGGEAPLHAYLPPGLCLLLVDVGNVPRSMTDHERRAEVHYGVTELPCEIRPGGTTEVDARLWAGGLLDLALFGDKELSEFEARSIAAACAVSARKRSSASADAPDAELWPVMLDGGPRHRRPLQLEMQYDARRRKQPSSAQVERGSNGQFRAVGDVTLRIRTTVEPGNYNLRVCLPGFAPLERMLVIRAGEDQDLSLALTRSARTR